VYGYKFNTETSNEQYGMCLIGFGRGILGTESTNCALKGFNLFKIEASDQSNKSSKETLAQFSRLV
jgi:hypothetical protein